MEFLLCHHSDLLCRPSKTCVQPVALGLAKRTTLIEQNHVVELAALRLVSGQRPAIREFVRLSALAPVEVLFGACEKLIQPVS